MTKKTCRNCFYWKENMVPDFVKSKFKKGVCELLTISPELSKNVDVCVVVDNPFEVPWVITKPTFSCVKFKEKHEKTDK